MTEADAGLPETTEQALELSKARLTGDSTPPKPAVAVDEQPSEAQAADEADEGAQPEGQPEADAEADFSNVADPKFRAALESGNKVEVAKRLREWQASVTKKEQAAAARLRQAEAWEALGQVEGAQEVIADLLAGRTPARKQPEPEPVPDFTQMTNEEILAQIDARAEKRAKALIEQTVEERFVAPRTRAEKILNVAVGLFDGYKSNLTEDAYRATWAQAVDHYGEAAFTPENTERLFKPFLEAAVTKAELAKIKGARTQDAEVARRATSPAGSGKAASGIPPEAPKRDGKAQTARAKTRQEMLERFGWTESVLDRAAK